MILGIWSFHYIGPGDRTQLARFGSKPLCLLSHLNSPCDPTSEPISWVFLSAVSAQSRFLYNSPILLLLRHQDEVFSSLRYLPAGVEWHEFSGERLPRQCNCRKLPHPRTVLEGAA